MTSESKYIHFYPGKRIWKWCLLNVVSTSVFPKLLTKQRSIPNIFNHHPSNASVRISNCLTWCSLLFDTQLSRSDDNAYQYMCHHSDKQYLWCFQQQTIHFENKTTQSKETRKKTEKNQHTHKNTNKQNKDQSINWIQEIFETYSYLYHVDCYVISWNISI